MTDKRLKSFADRIDRLEDERKELGGDIKDVYTEVKSAGYNTKALRKVLAERRKKSDAELEADMELYRAALAEPGATYRSVAEKTGVPRSTLHRLVPRKINGTETTHDADGVITEYNAGPDEGASGSSQTPNNAPQADRQESPAMPLPNGGVGDGTHSGGDAQDESCGGVESRHAPVRENAPDALLGSDSERGKPPAMAAGTDPVNAGETTPSAPETGTSLNRGGSESRQAGVAPGPHDTSLPTTNSAVVASDVDQPRAGQECSDIAPRFNNDTVPDTRGEARPSLEDAERTWLSSLRARRQEVRA